MKKKIIATTLLILLVVVLCVMITLSFNPNLNVFKLRSVERNALEYINQTYPEFIVDDITVRHEWKSNHYVVDYNDGTGDSRTVVFDHTGETVFADEYLVKQAYTRVRDYESSIELKITEALKQQLSIDAYYVLVEDQNAYGRDRDIVLGGLDISQHSVTCSIGVTGDDESNTLDFATLSKEIYVAVTDLDLPIEQIEIHQQNAPDSQFDIVCPVNMDEMSIEEIDKLVQ